MGRMGEWENVGANLCVRPMGRHWGIYNEEEEISAQKCPQGF